MQYDEHLSVTFEHFSVTTDVIVFNHYITSGKNKFIDNQIILIN